LDVVQEVNDMNRISYYALKPRLSGQAPITLFQQDEKNELFVGPHVRLAGFPGMAHIETRELAEEYAENIRPVLKRRHGEESDVEVHEIREDGTKRLLDRIQRDSDIVRKRLATGNLSPNKPV